MFAILEIGGKQYKVQEGDNIYVEKIEQEDGSKISYEEIIMIDGNLGNPYVSGAKVEAEIVKRGKGKKIRIYKFQSKKHHLKRQGHRQPYTKLLITKVVTN